MLRVSKFDDKRRYCVIRRYMDVSINCNNDVYCIVTYIKVAYDTVLYKVYINFA